MAHRQLQAPRPRPVQGGGGPGGEAVGAAAVGAPRSQPTAVVAAGPALCVPRRLAEGGAKTTVPPPGGHAPGQAAADGAAGRTG